MQENNDPRVATEISRDALGAAVEAATAAAEIIRQAAPTLASLEWVVKGTADFVTEVDRSAEGRIAEIVARHFPEAAIVGEELSPAGSLAGDRLTFVCDPLDGTTNFLHGYPQYAVSIGVMHEAELIAAVVLNVARGDLFTAVAGGGTRLNGVPATVSAAGPPARALIGTGFPFRRHDLLEQHAQQFLAVSRQTAGIRRAGSAALDLADVACGRFDGFWELTLAPWDMAAGILLIREAGGIITDLDGHPLRPAHSSVVAGNPEIHAWLLETVTNAGST